MRLQAAILALLATHTVQAQNTLYSESTTDALRSGRYLYAKLLKSPLLSIQSQWTSHLASDQITHAQRDPPQYQPANTSNDERAAPLLISQQSIPTRSHCDCDSTAPQSHSASDDESSLHDDSADAMPQHEESRAGDGELSRDTSRPISAASRGIGAENGGAGKMRMEAAMAAVLGIAGLVALF